MEGSATFHKRKGKRSVSVAAQKFPSRLENFLIDTEGFKIRKQRSIDAVVFWIVRGLCQIVLLIEVFEIKLGNAILERGERGATPMTKGIPQKHEIADNTVGNHGFAK